MTKWKKDEKRPQKRECTMLFRVCPTTFIVDTLSLCSSCRHLTAKKRPLCKHENLPPIFYPIHVLWQSRSKMALAQSNGSRITIDTHNGLTWYPTGIPRKPSDGTGLQVTSTVDVFTCVAKNTIGYHISKI